ncbi:MAG: glycosyltransferase family 2 protein [Thermoleophilaceae bacterium]
MVIATRDRPEALTHTVERLTDLDERPPVVVVDNASERAGTRRAMAQLEARPGVEVLRLETNRGGAARTAGAELLLTPYVAFADDDSWWAHGALAGAVAILEAHPRLGLVAGRVLVGPEESEDPVNEAMARSPLPPDGEAPGPRVLGFVACGAVVRRAAYLAVGGFHPAYGIGGEEELLALDLSTAGWGLSYVETVVAHHHPSASRDLAARRRGQLRNALWTAWLRRSPRAAIRRTREILRAAGPSLEAVGGAVDALRGLRWVAAERRPVAAELEADLRRLEG